MLSEARIKLANITSLRKVDTEVIDSLKGELKLEREYSVIAEDNNRKQGELINSLAERLNKCQESLQFLNRIILLVKSLIDRIKNGR